MEKTTLVPADISCEHCGELSEFKKKKLVLRILFEDFIA